MEIELDPSIETEILLGEALSRTRQEKEGISLERIALVIKENLDRAERASLIRELSE